MLKTTPVALCALSVTLAGWSGSFVQAQSALQADPQRVAQAQAGELAEVNAAWWGFDEADATRAIQAAIDSGAKKVVIPNMGKPWIVTPITLGSNQEIVFEDGVVVEAKKGEYQHLNDVMFLAYQSENIILRGPKATLRMHKKDYQNPPYSKGEWRHAIALFSAKNVQILGLTIEGSGGDGIYITGASQYRNIAPPKGLPLLPYSENVVIRGVTCKDHHRQGISVISAHKLVIEDCILEGTDGTNPQAGIDFEPNHAGQQLSEIVMRRCITRNNTGAGFMIYATPLNHTSAPISIRFEDCHSINDRDGFIYYAKSDPGQGVKGMVEMVNSTLEKSRAHGVAIWTKAPLDSTVRIANTTLLNPAPQKPGLTPIALISQTTPNLEIGGVTFDNVTIVDDIDRQPMAMRDRAGGTQASHITGSLSVTRQGKTQQYNLTPEIVQTWLKVQQWHKLDLVAPASLSAAFQKTAGKTNTLKPVEFAPLVRGIEFAPRFAVFAQQGDQVTLRVKHKQFGPKRADHAPLVVLDPQGQKIHEQNIALDANTDVTFAAQAAGGYQVIITSGPSGVAITHATHPVNLYAAQGRVNLKKAVGTLYFWVPPNTPAFILNLSGQGLHEGIKPTVIDGQGKVYRQFDAFAEVQQLYIEYSNAKPCRGELWQIRLSPPDDMYFGDSYIEMQGLAPLLAVSRDAVVKLAEPANP